MSNFNISINKFNHTFLMKNLSLLYIILLKSNKNKNMKHHILTLAILFLTCSCSDDIPEQSGGLGNNQVGPSKPNSVINAKLFDIIDLSYPGLEKAKEFYDAELYYDAAKAILDYYRQRTDIKNPSISLINITVSEDDKLKANFALDNNRFFVNNYYEDASTKKPYSLNKEGKIDWTFKPDGADDEYQKQLHRHQWFVPQAKVYRTTNDEKYIQSWISVYKDWLISNPMPESGTNNTTWWQLQVAERTVSQTQLFDYYKNSVNFTPEWFSEFMCHFAEHADFLVKYPYTQGGNILISQANALAFAGVLFPEFRNASVWMNAGYSILDEEVKKQFLDDGMHYELDFSYHISAIADFYETIKLSEANPSITGNLPADFNTSLHKAAQIVMHFTFPNFFDSKSGGYLVPGFNDTRQSSWTRSVLTRNYNRYVEMFPDDQELLYMGTAGKQGKQPDFDPKSFISSGYYILRNGWEKSSTMMILSNNYSEEAIKVWSHKQPDNGTFELYHNGRNFFPDTGVYSYYTSGGDNSSREWYRQTKVHNTMTLDGKNITEAKGKSLKITTVNNVEIIAFENLGYSNLKHRRYIFYVNKSFFVLVDEGIGSASGTINLNFNLCEGNDNEVIIDTNQNKAYTAFSDGNNMLIQTFGNNVITTASSNGKVSYTPGVEAARKAFSVNMTKTAEQTSRYITVLYPVDNADSAQINATFKNNDFMETGVSLQVIINGTTYDLNCNL